MYSIINHRLPRDKSNPLKKPCTLLTFLLALAILLPACAAPGSAPQDCNNPEVFCIGLVTDVSGIKDNPYNQAILSAVQQAKQDLGAQIDTIETAEANDYSKNISYFADAGYDVVVSAGAALGKVTFQAAADHPEIKFIGIDQFLNPAQPSPSNLISVIYPRHYLVGPLVGQATQSEKLSPDQAGFLVGAIAARTTQTKKIGAVCLPEQTPLLQLFCEGYKAGAAHISPNVEVTIAYQDIISVNPTTLEKRSVLDDMLDKGVDVIFGPRDGQAGGDVVSEAAQKGIHALGVDSDENLTLPKVRKMLSGTRPITIILFKLFKQTKAGAFPDGLKYVNEVSDYAPFRDLISQLPEDLKIEIEKIQNSLLEGSLQTNAATPEPTPLPLP